MIRQTISHYQVIEKLGDGATAEVYKAEDLALGRPVALKLVARELSEDYGMIARFQHEARTASSLNHPNICTIYEIAEHEGRHFIVMELLNGQTLSRVLAAGPMAAHRVIELGIQIADALDTAHAGGIVHRDIKPANIFITDRDQVKILDFGLAVPLPARDAGQKMPQMHPGTTSGTAPYMSPEQVRGEALDARSDLFSTGVVLYEMITGRRAFNGRDIATIMHLIVNQPVSPMRELDRSVHPELERIVGKALEKNRKLRFQSAADLRADLHRLKRDLDSAEALVVRGYADGDNVPRRPAMVPRGRRRAAIAGLFIAGGAMAVMLISNVQTARRYPSEVAPPASPGRAARGHIVLLPPLSAMPPHTPARNSTAMPAERVAPAVTVVAESSVLASGKSWAEQELRVARAKIDARLFDQALLTLQALAVKGDAGDAAATEAYFMMASVHETQGRIEDAMAAYLEFAHRYPDHARAPEALFLMAQNTLRTRRPTRDADARRLFSEVAASYPHSAWAPKALMMRAELEERQKLYQRDDMLGASVPSALVTYRQIATQYPATPATETALWKLGHLYAGAKRYRLAADAFTVLGTRYPATQFDAWYAAADLLDERLKDRVSARAAYMQVPLSSPRYRDAQKRLR